jgi:hypothetical protein
VSQGIGAYADIKRDDAVTALQAAKDRGDTEGMAAALVDYNNWDEGGKYRIGMHIAGGALTAGLGGGSIGSAAQGAAGAGLAAWAAGDLNRLANGTRDALGGGDAAQMAGNVLSNVVAGAGGFLIGGTTGAFTASNADLYNRSTGNGNGKGSTNNSLIGDVVDWAQSTYGSPVDDLRRWAGQFAGQVASNNGQTPPADPNPLTDAHNGNPPATGGAVVTPAAVVCVPGGGCAVSPPVVSPGTAGYVPSNATLNSGDNGAAKSGNEATQPVTADNFFDGTTYTSKVRNQAASGDYHGFPQSADAFSGEGTVQPITGGDGVTRWKLTIPGSYNGTAGIFEYIRNPDGTINHRLFVPTK